MPRIFSSDCTFPDNTDAPALLSVIFDVLSIAFLVALEFVLPELRIGFRRNKIFAAFVCMPEASVYKDYCIGLWEYDVRLAGISLVTDSIAESCPVKGFSDVLFWRSVL